MLSKAARRSLWTESRRLVRSAPSQADLPGSRAEHDPDKASASGLPTPEEVLRVSPSRRVRLAMLARRPAWPPSPFQSFRLKGRAQLDAALQHFGGRRQEIKTTKKKVELKTHPLVVESLAESRELQERGSEAVEHNEALEANVAAYIAAEAADGSGGPLLAVHQQIEYFCKRTSEADFPPLSSAAPFAALVRAFADRRAGDDGLACPSDLERITELLHWMAREEVRPDLRTVAAVLHGYRPTDDAPPDNRFPALALRLVEESLGQDEAYHIRLEDLLLRRFYTEAEKERLVEAVRVFRPNFEALREPVIVGNVHPLVQRLNEPCPLDGNPFRTELSEAELLQRLGEQSQMELRGTFQVPSVFKAAEDKPKKRRQGPQLDQLHDKWRAAFRDGLEELIERKDRDLSGRQGHEACQFYLHLLPVEEMAEVLLEHAKQLSEISEVYSRTLAGYSRDLGERLERRVRARKREEAGVTAAVRRVYARYLRFFTAEDGALAALGPRRAWHSCLVAEGVSCPSWNIDLAPWPPRVRRVVGGWLMDVLTDAATVPERRGGAVLECPAFLRPFRKLHPDSPASAVHLTPRPSFLRLMMETPERPLSFDVQSSPALVPPLPWLSHRNGGLLVSQVDFTRPTRTQSQLQAQMVAERLEASDEGRYHPVLDSLNQLSAVAWTTNVRVFDVMMDVFNGGGDRSLDIPPRAADLPHPPKISPSTSHEDSRAQWAERHRKRKEVAETHSLWCSSLYKFSIAAAFQGRTVWFPMNMDFRGRLYPVAPHFSHVGDDVSRGLLHFAAGKRLGPEGLRWLKLHCMGLTGAWSKRTLAEREAGAEEALADILDSARAPLAGRGWWRQSEEPWQTLAVCMEIEAALREEGGPEAFVSRLPVHQDGSCNGLQHYAALGRDEAGAASVNVLPGDRPADVYAQVAELVEQQRAEEARSGSAVPASIPAAFIDRSIVKRTVMTIVYGVTHYGARLQVQQRFKELGIGRSEESAAQAAWIAKATFASIAGLFTSARLIQDWLTEASKLISRECCRTVEWESPLGLPVVQPYVARKVVRRAGREQRRAVLDQPRQAKQAFAFPPNYIHSLDSAHMMLTGLACQHHGLTFASVHDCFWTHAADVPLMGRLCREEFLRLHSQPLLHDLSHQFLRTYLTPDLEHILPHHRFKALQHELTSLPPLGDLDLSRVLDSPYFFS